MGEQRNTDRPSRLRERDEERLLLTLYTISIVNSVIAIVISIVAILH